MVEATDPDFEEGKKKQRGKKGQTKEHTAAL